MVIFHSFLYVYQRVTYGSQGGFSQWIRTIPRLMLPRGEARQRLGAPQQEEGLEQSFGEGFGLK